MYIIYVYVCAFVCICTLILTYRILLAFRYIAVCHPLLRQKMCTVSRARKVAMILSGLAGLGYSFGAWTSGVMESNGVRRCTPLPQYMRVITVLNNIDTVITLIIPSAAIFAMNIRITYKIMYVFQQRTSMTSSFLSDKHFQRQSKQIPENSSITNVWECRNLAMMDQEDESVATRDLRNNSTSTVPSVCDNKRSASSTSSDARGYNIVRNSAQIKITKMLLIISTIFLLLNLPSHSLRVYAFLMNFTSSNNYNPPLIAVLLQQAFTMIYNLNFAINFFLYSLCGKNFRAALCRLLRKCRMRMTQTMCFACRNTRWYVRTTQGSVRRTSSRLQQKHTRSGSTRFTRC